MKRILLIGFCVLFSSFLLAQNKKKQDLKNNLKSNTKIESFFINPERQTPSMVKINGNYNLTIEAVPDFLKDILLIKTEDFQLECPINRYLKMVQKL